LRADISRPRIDHRQATRGHAVKNQPWLRQPPQFISSSVQARCGCDKKPAGYSVQKSFFHWRETTSRLKRYSAALLCQPGQHDAASRSETSQPARARKIQIGIQ
jgi:hypothetical protein